MTIESDISEWANQRPDWQRAVLVRLCDQEVFDEDAIFDIADALINSRSESVRVLSETDVPGGSPTGASVVLGGLKDFTNVNALSPEGPLTFGPSGLTIVYGDNGSGKSGYARILKEAAGARARETILGNVFISEEDEPQSAVVQYSAIDLGPDLEWSWPSSPPAELQRIRFYDEKCGRVYLNEKSDVSYRPSALALIDQLIVVCDEVRGKLDEHLRDCDGESTSLPTVPEGSEAQAFLKQLSSKTKASEIDVACTLPTGGRERLGKLLTEEARLKGSDPPKERKRLGELKGNLDLVATHVSLLHSSLNPEGQAALVTLRKKAQELRAAATIASSTNFDSEPVSGVGGEMWRALWDAARAFSEADGYADHTFPFTGDGSRCVFCHQELSPDARDRLTRFQHFMMDTTETEAKAAEKALGSARSALQTLAQLPAAVATALTKIREVEVERADMLILWLDAAANSAEATVGWIDGDLPEQPDALCSDPSEGLRDRSEELEAEAEAIDAASFADSMQTATAARSKLEGGIALGENKVMIEAEVLRLQRRSKIEEAKKAVDTGAITRKASEITRAHVTQPVLAFFLAQCESFHVGRVTLRDEKGEKGKLRHRPGLDGALRKAEIADVLSEGEKTALAISGFLTELEFDDSASSVVLDDPVTSLDHTRRALVAQRLAEVAKQRPVIVFTHELVFVGDLMSRAKQVGVDVAKRWVQRRGDNVGMSVEDFPWSAKDVAARIGDLTELLARITRDRSSLDQAEYDEQCAGWGGKLSETWERAVSMEIIYEVIDRGTSHVMPKKFRILASVTPEDDSDFQAGYDQGSTWARRHDKDLGVIYVAPEPSEMQTELDRLKVWFGRVKKYRK